MGNKSFQLFLKTLESFQYENFIGSHRPPMFISYLQLVFLCFRLYFLKYCNFPKSYYEIFPTKYQKNNVNSLLTLHRLILSYKRVLISIAIRKNKILKLINTQLHLIVVIYILASSYVLHTYKCNETLFFFWFNIYF